MIDENRQKLRSHPRQYFYSVLRTIVCPFIVGSHRYTSYIFHHAHNMLFDLTQHPLMKLTILLHPGVGCLIGPPG